MYTIIKTDLKNILRDPSLLIMCFVPFIMLAVLRWGYPALLTIWPEISDYSTLILAMFCITGSIMPGIAIAFAMLDEKDQNLHVVLQVLPVSFKTITFYRMGIIYGFGFLTSLLLLSLSGMEKYSFMHTLLLSVLTAATAPIMALTPAFFAANKIDGATFTKALNFIIMLPIPAFLFPGIWNYFFMILPAWWIYYAFANIHNSFHLWMGVLGGLLMHMVVLAVLIKIIFNRMKSFA